MTVPVTRWLEQLGDFKTPRFGCAVAALLPAMLEGWKLKNILMGPMAIYFFNSSGNGENDLEELDFREKLPRPSTCGRVSDPIGTE
ncbi:hypothetical protein T4B_14066 [Trichinella pseudospiralis]|uniref:Uncharacterized protein n=2 Tax=Trichinella pseudospiralis TaxID=6337 RepID=A0A0V1J523_TRIPS|nr:hypothetical protein T4A_10436 [Trichinella pseudospiralis]KRY84840.1 hypothetical protein T4D_1522 [Trichinella pseudospiralis]KRZ23449.1 hypothetical protein T4B_14066 [Trichinella pseudospiralis]KRZ30029.1 hypothetical protein T4C_7155 [Trichinella pseudospiralis]